MTQPEVPIRWQIEKAMAWIYCEVLLVGLVQQKGSAPFVKQTKFFFFKL